MGSSNKINSKSVDHAGAANEIDMVKCDHFSIRGFVAEMRERDHRKCWPFSEESLSLVDQGSYSLPSLFVPKSRWWGCKSCIRDINADGTKGNATEENEDVSCEISQKDDETATTSVKKLHHPRSMDASTVRSKRKSKSIQRYLPVEEDLKDKDTKRSCK